MLTSLGKPVTKTTTRDYVRVSTRSSAPRAETDFQGSQRVGTWMEASRKTACVFVLHENSKILL